MQDSMGDLTSAGHSTQLPAKSLNLRVFTEADALKCLGRLAVVYGDAKIIDTKQRRLLAFEWAEAFAYFEPERVHNAIGKVLVSLKFWPTIAEVMDALKANTPPLPPAPPHRAEKVEFCREGRTEAEEIAYRAAQVLAMRRSSGFGSAPDITAVGEVKHVPKEAVPDDGFVSPALEQIARKRGYWRGAA